MNKLINKKFMCLKDRSPKQPYDMIKKITSRLVSVSTLSAFQLIY